MITKTINWQGFNLAVINGIDSDGRYIWDARKIQTTDGKEVTVTEVLNLGSMPSVAPFTLNDEDIHSLTNPELELSD